MHPKEGGGGELREKARGARQREREVMFSMSSDVMRKRFVSSLRTQRIQSGALAFFLMPTDERLISGVRRGIKLFVSRLKTQIPECLLFDSLWGSLARWRITMFIF